MGTLRFENVCLYYSFSKFTGFTKAIYCRNEFVLKQMLKSVF